jgi:hypothetical protein
MPYTQLKLGVNKTEQHFEGRSARACVFWFAVVAEEGRKVRARISARDFIGADAKHEQRDLRADRLPADSTANLPLHLTFFGVLSTLILPVN